MTKVALVQLNSTDDVAANLLRCTDWLVEAKSQGAELVLLPENFAFLGNNEKAKLAIAEPWSNGGSEHEGGQIQEWLAQIASALGLWVVAGSVPIKSPSGKTFATQIVVDAGGKVQARYDKIHLFDVRLDDGTDYLESRAIDAGDAVVVCDSPVGQLGLSICYDVRFPELYRQLVTQGAEVITVPAAFTAPTGEAHWHSLLRARAIETQCYVLAANQVGEHVNGRASFGHSMVIDPWGKVLAEMPAGDGNHEGVIYADIDKSYLQDVRTRFPVQQHRRLPLRA